MHFSQRKTKSSMGTDDYHQEQNLVNRADVVAIPTTVCFKLSSFFVSYEVLLQ